MAVRVQLVSLVDEELLGLSTVISKLHIGRLGQRAHLQEVPASNQHCQVHWGMPRKTCHPSIIAGRFCCVLLTAPLHCSLSSVLPCQLSRLIQPRPVMDNVLEPFPKPTYVLTSEPKQLQKAMAGGLQRFVIHRAVQRGPRSSTAASAAQTSGSVLACGMTGVGPLPVLSVSR